MNLLSFTFASCEVTLDHQARVLIDGQDILTAINSTWFGIDPVKFFDQEALRSSGTLYIGRCSCGEIGCNDAHVSVARSFDEVEWTSHYPQAQRLVFRCSDYDRAVEEAASDLSWENTNRTAERLVSQLDYS